LIRGGWDMRGEAILAFEIKRLTISSLVWNIRGRGDINLRDKEVNHFKVWANI